MYESAKEFFILPSLGKVYGNKDISPNISLRPYVTVEDERLRGAPASYQPVASLIDDCLIDKPGISAYDLCMGDYLFLLHRLRIITHGPEYKLGVMCSFCGHYEEDVIKLTDLFVKQFDEETEKDFIKYSNFELPVSKKTISLKMQTPRIKDEARRFAKEAIVANKFPYELGAVSFYEMLLSIDKIDGVSMSILDKEQLIGSLVAKDGNVIDQYSRRLNDLVGIDSRVSVKCDFCGTPFNAQFRETSEFFRPTL